MDTTRDGAPDIVVTRDDAANPDLGTTSWLVYPAGATGFPNTAETWALPGGYADQLFIATADTSSATPTWGLVSLDDDAPLDLVFTADPAAGEDLGTTEWLVYAGTCAR